MPYYCGIDLGTTNSTLSVINIERRSDDPIKKLSTIPIYQYNESFNGIDKAKTLLPSFLYFNIDKKRVYTGYYAKSVYASGDRPMQTVTAVKTRIGTESVVEIPSINSSKSETFDMTQCSAILLRTIMDSFKEQYDGQKIENVVITVPAAFNTDEREATLNAARIAGFANPKILDEPTATLLYYINGGENALNNLDSDVVIEDDSNILVYDLGGGTLDVCIARIHDDDDGNAKIDIISRSPRQDFGGNDFDQQLGAYFLYDFEKARESIETHSPEEQNTIISRIVSKAEAYKIELNEKIIDKKDNPRLLQRVKSEAVFEVISGMKVDTSINKEILDQVFLTLTEPNGKILQPVKYCLGEAGLNASDISMVVLTGGMTKYYAVRQTLEAFFGETVAMIEVDAQNSVSKGAAIHCYNECGGQRLKRLNVSDRMADDIFLKLNGKFEKIIPRDVTVGCGEFDYIIPEDRMLKIPIFLYHGLNENEPADFTPIAGKYIYLDNINKEFEKGSVIKLKWTLDENKIISITLSELDTSLQFSSAGILSDEYINNNIVQKYTVNPK